MAERAALGVLTGDANRDARCEQRAERERFGHAPIDEALFRDRRFAALELRDELLVDREPVGHADEIVGPRQQLRLVDRHERRGRQRRRLRDLLDHAAAMRFLDALVGLLQTRGRLVDHLAWPARR